MNREEMIRDVCEAHIQSPLISYLDSQRYWCHECHKYEISGTESPSLRGKCTVFYAVKLLPEPSNNVKGLKK